MPPRTGVLVIAPHPDDEAFGCGGTIRLLTTSGVPVDVLFMTRGERGTEEHEKHSPEKLQQTALIRAAEARESCAALGVRAVDFLEGEDANLHNQPHLAGELLRRIVEGGYNRVFSPWPHDGHSDHKATFQLLKRALIAYDQPIDVWLYEVWTPLRPSICIPIDTMIEAKIAAMEAHRSQLDCLGYKAAFLGLAAYRSLFCPTSKYAEAFMTGTREWATSLEGCA